MKAWTGSIGVALAAALVIIMSAGTAAAAPSRLARSEFTAAVAGLPTIVETFDGFMEGMYPPAIPLANGVYAATGPWVYRVGALNSVLSDGSDVGGPRTFSAFANGTRYWGADVGMDGRSVLSVTVVGAAETVMFEVRADELQGFLGITDPVGLRAVTIVNAGEFNLAFDNVTTASGAPEPRTSAELVSPTAPAPSSGVVVLDVTDEPEAAVMPAAGTDGDEQADVDGEAVETESAGGENGAVPAQPAEGDENAGPRTDEGDTAPRRTPVLRGSKVAGDTTGTPHVAAAPAPRLTTTR